MPSPSSRQLASSLCAMPLALLLLFVASPVLAQKAGAAPVSAPANGLITNSIGMKLVQIPAGSFTMGSNSNEASDDEKPQHRVTISQGFYMAATEVTQGQWEAVMGSKFRYFQGDDRPVTSVSWDDAQAFCAKLSAKEGKAYRLPSEAEWEYACRAGTTGDRYGEVDAIAWCNGDETHPVGQKQPNAFGLYDMLGNVMEWCSDWHGDYPSTHVMDPKGPQVGQFRVLRGGDWYLLAKSSRSSDRFSINPDHGNLYMGFRPVRTLR